MGAMKARVSMNYGLVVLFLVIFSLWCSEAMIQAKTKQLGVRKLLKRLNKPAIKSIKSPDGDIIDCVHISHQPAFDHPLLKNHTIQMRPSSPPSGLHDEYRVASKMETGTIRQLWHENGWCPEGTIPIRRNKKEDVLRASSIERYGKKSHRTNRNPTSGHLNDDSMVHEHALVRTMDGSYYGTKATFNVWNPKVESPLEFSLSQLWIVGHPLSSDTIVDTIEVGWHVYPYLNHDNRTRLFIFSTHDGYRSGCYNLRCPGFIQVNKEIAIGASLNPISSYGGCQYEITLLAWKDPQTKNWWLQIENLSPLGYWPSSLFSHLTYAASEVDWGGEIMYSSSNSQHTSTEMGSGHFPEEGFGKASYIRNIQVVDKSNNLIAPRGIDTFAQQSDCYSIKSYDNGYFYYGGPGRNPNCP